jgi:hypothetical protein
MAIRLGIATLAVVSALTSACSSSSDDTQAPAPAETQVAIRGAYVPSNPASTASISLLFVESDTRYYLRAKGCASASCEEHGSFRFDESRHSLDLVVDGTGKSYSLPFDIMAARPTEASEVRPSSLKPAFTPAETPTVPDPADDEKGTLTGGSVELVNGAVSLIASLVSLEGEAFESMAGGGKTTLHYLGSSSFLQKCAGKTLGCGKAVSSVSDSTPYFSAPSSGYACNAWFTFKTANGGCAEAQRLEVSDKHAFIEGSPGLFSALGLSHSDGSNCAGSGQGSVTMTPGRHCND